MESEKFAEFMDRYLSGKIGSGLLHENYEDAAQACKVSPSYFTTVRNPKRIANVPKKAKLRVISIGMGDPPDFLWDKWIEFSGSSRPKDKSKALSKKSPSLKEAEEILERLPEDKLKKALDMLRLIR